MLLFTADRERRLWLWALVVVVAIFSTLGLAPGLADVLRDRELLDAVFGLGMLLVVVTVVTLALKARPGGVEVGVMLGIAATMAVTAIAALRWARQRSWPGSS